MTFIPRKFRILLLLCAFLLWIPAARAEENVPFSVKRDGQMISHARNSFTVTAPEDGVFSVTVRDQVCTYRVIREAVRKGTQTVEWDGCGYNGETLAAQYYTFEFALEGESGQRYSFAFDSPIVGNAQHLKFVLPSGAAASLAEPDEWFLEVKSVLDGTLILDFCPENSPEPVFSAKMTLHLRRVEHFTLGQILGKKRLEPGNYTVRAYEATRPDEAAVFSLRVEAEALPDEPVWITGEIMPDREAGDAELWRCMTEPAVVVDIDCTAHQKIYSEPDAGSPVLGTLHGQTQCLSVYEIRDGWAKIGAWNHEDASYAEGWVPAGKLKTVRPNTEYGLLLDKKAQTLTVFFRGERIETLLVSTGRMEARHFDRETSAGCFVTGLHRVDFSTQGNRYDFVIQYDGGNLLHQIPYTSDGKKDFTYGRAYLGSKASHACIRIQAEPGSRNGINAYWIWTHIPYHTKLIILDDAEEREKEKAILTGNTPAEAAEYPDSGGNGTDPGEAAIKITFCGNVTPGNGEDYFGNPKVIGAALEQYGPEYPLNRIRELFAADDLTCANLDCVLAGNRNGEDYSRSNRLRGLPEYAEILSRGSVELVCLANDHLDDYRSDGFSSTVQALEGKAGWVGSGQSRVEEIRGVKFGFGACTEQEYLSDPGLIEKEIRALRAQGCRFVVWQCHWGEENSERHGQLQEAMARACSRAGADLVIGHHPKAVQGMDRIGGMPVLYSLGTLMESGSVRAKSYDALIVQALFYPEKEESAPEIRLIPVLSSSSAGAKTNDFQPCIAEGEDREWILRLVQKDSAVDVRLFAGE